MKVTYDKVADAVYITLKEVADGEVSYSVEAVRDDIIMDFDAQGHLVGIDVQYANSNLSPEVLQEAEVIS